MDKNPIALLCRHGDTDQNDANVFRSRLDPPLNARGVRQAEDVASFINGSFSVSEIVSSPLLRALETADIIADAVDAEVIQDRGLISWALGSCLTGRDKDLYADILDFYVDNPSKTPPEGESLYEFTQRTQEFFEPELKSLKPKDSIPIFVTHSSNILTLGLILDKNAKGRQESEELVGPGGIMAVYKTKDGFELEAVFGEEVHNEYGS